MNKQQSREKGRWSLVRAIAASLVKLAVAAAIVFGAVWIYRYQMRTSPRAERKRPLRQAKLVHVTPVRSDRCRTVVTAMGTVIPAQQVRLRPQVSGKVVNISDELIPGGTVSEGVKLVEIESRDYAIAVKQRESDVTRALRDLKVEQGNQEVARQEYKLLDEVITEQDRELVLRQPQLASALAALESARASLEKAQLDLARCEITAPFNAVVHDKHVDPGATVSLNSDLVTLTGTDEAWVEVMVPVGQLKWLVIPRDNGDSGSAVKILSPSVWGPDAFRFGRVVRLHGELETQGRMAKLVVVVEDPFCLEAENKDKPQLLMGSYVRAEIEGVELDSVFPVDRAYLRDNEEVWIMDEDKQLEIRPVEVEFRDPETVYVSDGLAEGELLVTTDIAAPVAGMSLRPAEVDDPDKVPDTEPQVPDSGGPRG